MSGRSVVASVSAVVPAWQGHTHRVTVRVYGADPLLVLESSVWEFGSLVSSRDRRRLAGARLVSTVGGDWADVLLEGAAVRLPELRGMNADQFVSWYVGECLSGLDRRAAGRDGVRWEDQVEPEPDADVAHRA